MFVQPQQQDNCQQVASAGLRRDGDQPPSTAASAPAIRSAPMATLTPADASYRRDDPVVGHRLANGWMSVHAMGQPCRYC